MLDMGAKDLPGKEAIKILNEECKKRGVRCVVSRMTGNRMKNKSSLWRFRYPGMDCAVDMRFAWAASEKEARAALTKKLKVRKLPQGTELWPEDDQ